MINVTKSYLPPLEEYVEYLQRIWASNQLTNNGPLVKELEAKIKDYLGVKYLFFVCNGTIALQIAIKAMNLQEEIITTPFSYVATTSSIVWEGCQPVFVDIDPETLCINPDLIEAAITPHTTAIMAVHVYGHPCDIERIQAIADQYKLKVIYDAAHAFGVKYRGVSITNFGDVSVLSFHATKLFHTVEGGAIVTNSDLNVSALEYMRRFGHKSPTDFWGLGINGKNSEFHAAMGLCVLPRVTEQIHMRHIANDTYDSLLGDLLNEGRICKPKCLTDTSYNYAYFPIIFSSEEVLLRVTNALNVKAIFPRRYFYPSLNKLNYVKYQPMPISESVSARVLCLPMFHDLSLDQITLICDIIRSAI